MDAAEAVDAGISALSDDFADDVLRTFVRVVLGAVPAVVVRVCGGCLALAVDLDAAAPVEGRV